MQIQNVNHISVNTINLADSIAFYEKIFGLTCLGEADLGDDYVAYMKVDDHTNLELFRTESGGMPVSDEERIGLKHLAFLVDDVFAWEKHLQKEGVPITFGPAYLKPIDQTVLLCKGPDHVILELVMEGSE